MLGPGSILCTERQTHKTKDEALARETCKKAPTPLVLLIWGTAGLRVNIHRQLSRSWGRRIHTSLELFLWNLRRQLRAHPEPQSVDSSRSFLGWYQPHEHYLTSELRWGRGVTHSRTFLTKPTVQMGVGPCRRQSEWLSVGDPRPQSRPWVELSRTVWRGLRSLVEVLVSFLVFMSLSFFPTWILFIHINRWTCQHHCFPANLASCSA